MSDEAYVRKVNLNFTIKLPANAPVDHPHIIEISPKDDAKATSDLSVVDVICTVMFKCNPQALHDLLNKKRKKSYYSLDTDDGSNHGYVSRRGEIVDIFLCDRVANKEHNVKFKIFDDGSWACLDSLGHLDPRERSDINYTEQYALAKHLFYGQWLGREGKYVCNREKPTEKVSSKGCIHKTADTVEPKSSDCGTKKSLDPRQQKDEAILQLISDVAETKSILRQTLEILAGNPKKRKRG
ncbi:hypothetical protein OCU04_001451 [Sclerotinia nivalis]|uniref:Uncharacterized protein n=1 Tax=Sclerotinia nivalis TaxID=352851 RepID=A0A9X0AYJ9_9HELO|nr:hypothetical protein OCU04_001451 [Sclerotinia nivalis]